MFISHIGFRNFRSIGDEPVVLDLTKRVNILIGPNNSGKSTVLAACQRWWAQKFNWSGLNETDAHQRTDSNRPGFVVVAVWTPEDKRNGLQNCTGRFEFDMQNPPTFRVTPFDELQEWRVFDQQMRILTNSHFPGVHGVATIRQETPKLAHAAIQKLINAIPKIVIIPAFRQITDGSYGVHGSGIVELLSHWMKWTPKIGPGEV